MSNFNLKELEILETMSAKEAMMLMGGRRYLTGSDYSEDYLQKEVGELEEEWKINLCDAIENKKFKWSGRIFKRGRSVIDDKIWEETKKIL